MVFPFETLVTNLKKQIKVLFFKVDAPPIRGRRTFSKFCALLESHKNYFCKYLCFGIICQYSICLCWLLGVKLRHPLLSFSNTKRPFASKRIVWCLFLQKELLTILPFVHCSLLCFCARGFCGHCVEGRQLY